MSLTLDPQTEQRILQVASAGHYPAPADLINHALDVLASEEPWSAEDRAELDRSLDEAMASIARGEGISGAESRARLARM